MRGRPEGYQGAAPARCFVFAYGSNLDEERMRDRVPSARLMGRASLRWHMLCFHKRGSRDGTGKANALRTERDGDEVHGVVYEIEPRHLDDLDRHEGAGRGYERRIETFSIAVDGRTTTVEAWMYVAEPDAIDNGLSPARWYLEHVLRGARAHGLPAELIRELEQVVTLD